MLHGKPLIAHTLIQAKASGLFDVIAVSSDSSEILSIAKTWGADLLIERPAELASDSAPKMPVVQHCLREAEKLSGLRFDTVVDLDPTSPLRSAGDILESVSLLEKHHVINVVTAAPARKSPYFNLVEVDAKNVVTLSKPLPQQVTRRQDAPKCYDMNASIYVWNRDRLLACASVFNADTMLYVMPEERSIDIDAEIDFQFVEFLMQKQGSLA